MRPDTNPRKAILDFLETQQQGIALLPLLKHMFAYHGEDTICRELDSLVEGGQVRISMTPNASENARLLFCLPQHAAVLPRADSTVIEIIMRRLECNQDGRGDFDRMMGVLALFDQVLAKAAWFKEPEWLAALNTMLAEKLLRFRSRPSNGYVTVTLVDVTTFTVIGYDPDTKEPYRFVVRAGAQDVALAKVRKEMRHHTPNLQILCTFKNEQDAEDIPQATPVEHIHL